MIKVTSPHLVATNCIADTSDAIRCLLYVEYVIFCENLVRAGFVVSIDTVDWRPKEHFVAQAYHTWPDAFRQQRMFSVARQEMSCHLRITPEENHVMG
jgi:hypothetical protein